MNPTRIAYFALALTAALGVATAQAQPYSIDWFSIDCGGQQYSTGGAWTLVGTIGQAEPGFAAAQDYRLAGGFWPGPGDACYVDLPEIALLGRSWLADGADLPADLDASGAVDLGDYALLAAYWLDYCPGSWDF